MKPTNQILRSISLLAFASTLFISQMALAARIDPDRVWFGVEYTFQDQEMVNEPGRATISTPYKEAKVRELTAALAARLDLPPSAIEIKETWKPGLYLNVPGDGQWVINSEPVTIEVNTTPRSITDLRKTAEPIFAAAHAVGLVAHVNPAAERSGMGHIHIGARNMAENPFFANPLLLRNVMVYVHKNPSLLHGFAEAFDIGMESNIETYHDEARQKEFQKAVADFDSWYDRASPNERANGFNEFLKRLSANDRRSDFFTHYRFINLEHVKRALERPFTGSDAGKFTIEFRNFRPPKDAATTHAFATLLWAVMEKQSAPNYKEPFKFVTEREYLHFNSATKVLENWSKVRSELDLNNRILDREVIEYADAVKRFHYRVPSIPGATLFLAYSQKTKKGRFFELHIPAKDFTHQPVLIINGWKLEFDYVKFGNVQAWVTVIDADNLSINPESLKSGQTPMSLRLIAPMCRAVLLTAAG